MAASGAENAAEPEPKSQELQPMPEVSELLSSVGFGALSSPLTAIEEVEVENAKLTEAIAWLFEAVESLQGHTKALESQLRRVDDAMEASRQRASAAQEDADGCQISGALSPEAGLPLQLQMRMSSLKCDLETCVQSRDLESLSSYIASKLEHFESKLLQDTGVLGTMLHTEGAGDRRRMQAQFESLSKDIRSNLELWEAKWAKAPSWEATAVAVAELNTRLSALEEQADAVPRLAPAAAAPAGSLRNKVKAGGVAPGQAAEPPADSLLKGMDSRLKALEAAARDERMGAPGRDRKEDPCVEDAPGSSSALQIQNLSARFQACEERLRILENDGATTAFRKAPPPQTAAGSKEPPEPEVPEAGLQPAPPRGPAGVLTRDLDFNALETAVGAPASAGAPGLDAGDAGSTRWRDDVEKRLQRLEDASAELVVSSSSAGRPLPGKGLEAPVSSVLAEEVKKLSVKVEQLGSRLKRSEEVTAGSAAMGEGRDKELRAQFDRLEQGVKSLELAQKEEAAQQSQRADLAADVVRKRFARIEDLRLEEEKRSQQQEKDQASRDLELRRHREALQNLTQLIYGDKFAASRRTSASDEPTAGEAAQQGEDPLKLLERRVHKAMERWDGTAHSASGSVVDRLQALESQQLQEAADFQRRLQWVEHTMRSLDIDKLDGVQPTIQRFRTDNERFTEDVRRDMQELKVLVGCIEACVPKETKNAVNLFKRAAGARTSAEDAITAQTPRRMQLESQVLGLREDMEARMKVAEGVCHDQCGKVVDILRRIEHKQELWETKLDELAGAALPPGRSKFPHVDTGTSTRPSAGRGSVRDQAVCQATSPSGPKEAENSKNFSRRSEKSLLSAVASSSSSGATLRTREAEKSGKESAPNVPPGWVLRSGAE